MLQSVILLSQYTAITSLYTITYCSVEAIYFRRDRELNLKYCSDKLQTPPDKEIQFLITEMALNWFLSSVHLANTVVFPSSPSPVGVIIPLDKGSASRGDLYLKTYYTHRRQISMSPAGFKPSNLNKRVAADPCLRPHGHSSVIHHQSKADWCSIDGL